MVTVVIPTYRRPIKLIKALKSVLTQTYDDIEIIVVDDDSEDIVNEGLLLNMNDKRISYVKNQRTKGANGARNTGLLRSKGEFVFYLDDDDVWYPNKIQEQLDKMATLDGTWAGCYCGWETDGKKFINGGEGDLLESFLQHRHKFGASSTLCFRKETLISVGLWDEDLPRYQDYELMARVYTNFKFGYVNKPLLNIDGHNVPNYPKLKIASDLYVKKMKAILKDVEEGLVETFLRHHYRSIAVFAALNGNLKETAKYLKLSVSNGILTPYSYANIFVYFLNYYSLRIKFGRFKPYMAEVFSKK